MAYTDLWKKLSSKQLNMAIQIVSLIAIFFEGFDQGVMGGVNSTPDYIETVGIGEGAVVTKDIKQGGIVAIFYLGAIFGCFGGGYLADRLGRVQGVMVAAVFSVIGGALQAGSISAAMFLVARVVSGIGAGALTSIVPVWIAEVAGAAHRGRYLGLVFLANYGGISVAYWLNFGLAFINDGDSVVRWRFPLAFQCLPAILLILSVRFLPDSPRYLCQAGRSEEAWEVLKHVRGDQSTPAEVQAEFDEMTEAAKKSGKYNPLEAVSILCGLAKGGRHLAKRAWLCIWLQLMAEWTGTIATTVYSSILLQQAGFGRVVQDGLASGINSSGIIGTLISAYIVDKFGRRRCLMAGAAVMALWNIIAAGIFEAGHQQPDKLQELAKPGISMLFLFNMSYAATWGTIAFLIPTEIFPTEMRAMGNGYGITGWSLGCGSAALANPRIFSSLGNRAYFLFTALDLLWIPFVYCLYPETNGRSLESIDVLFSLKSPFAWDAERAYREKLPELREKGLVADVESPPSTELDHNKKAASGADVETRSAHSESA